MVLIPFGMLFPIMFSPKSVVSPFCWYVQPQIRKSWDSMENANKKKVVISKFTLTCISLQTI